MIPASNVLDAALLKRHFLRLYQGIRRRSVRVTKSLLSLMWLHYQRLAHVAKSFERRHLASFWYSKHPALRTAATSLTWVTPRELLIDVAEGAFRRVFDFSRRRPSLPTFVCPFDPGFSTLFVIPVIAPGQCIRSIKLGVLGKHHKRSRLPIELAKTPDGHRLIDGFATYEPRYNQLIWDVPGGVFE